MRAITRHNKQFKYEYELTTTRRITDWLDNNIGYAILAAITFAVAMTVVQVAQFFNCDNSLLLIPC